MIRPLIFTDAPAYRDLRLQALKNDPESFLSDYAAETLQPLQFFSHTIARTTFPPIFGIYGFFEANQLVGTIQITPEYLSKTAHRAMIYFLYVTPQARKQHVASSLLHHIETLAKTTPTLEQLHLCVNSRNYPAIALYEKLGYKKIGTKPKGVKEPDGSYQDEHLYTKMV